ncbi:MAG: hypothetical protein MJ096_03920 [Clostridia bacterium]|nr:hypothetical protein [Clostridia bacterium]
MGKDNRGLWRYIVIGALFIAVCIVYITLFINLQVSGQDYYGMSTPIGYRTRTVKIQAQRGEIYDRNGKKLVGNVFYYDLMLDYGSMPQASSKKNAAIAAIVSYLKDSGSADKLTGPKYTPFRTTVSPDGIGFEYDDGFFELARASKYRKLADDLGIGEDAAAEDAAYAFMRYYGLVDKDGVLFYSPEITSTLFGYRLDLDLVDFSAVSPYKLAEDIPIGTISLLEESGTRGFFVSCRYERVYFYHGYASHLLGRVGKIPEGSADYYTELGYPLDAVVGTSGVEQSFEEYLHGADGEMTVVEDSNGNTLSAEITKEPTAGEDVYLTIDIDMQIKAEEALAYNIEYIHEKAAESGIHLYGEDSKAGALTALDPKTNEVLALASYPTYDLSTFVEDSVYLSEDETAPMLNRALSGTYAPGSTFKPGVAVAALDSGTVDEWETVNCTGVYDYYAGPSGQGYSPECWIHLMYGGHHGPIAITEAIQESCNFFFYDVGRRLTIEKLDEYMKHFGLGQPTGIELPEKTGVLAGPDYRNDNGLDEWAPGDTLQAAIGQSDHLFTPLQMSVYISTLINDGTRYSAHILKEVRPFGSDEPSYVKEAEIVEKTKIKSGVTDIVMNGMKDVIENGSASEVFEDYPIAIGGKTGTAQVSKLKSDNAVFTAFAPFDNPEIVATCVIEQGNTGSNAGVAVKELFNFYFGFDGESSDEEDGIDIGFTEGENRIEDDGGED